MSEEIRVNIGARLREERERLGLSQPAFADIGEASARTAQDWERGVSAPKGDFLARAAAAGVDVLYVLTGRRSTPFETTMTDEEVALVENYRRANPNRQMSVGDVHQQIEGGATFSAPVSFSFSSAKKRK